MTDSFHRVLWAGWLSKSQVKQFERCPYAWYLRNILHQPGEERPELTNGSNVHEILNWVYDQKPRFESVEELRATLFSHPDSENYGPLLSNFLRIIERWTLSHPLFREYSVRDQDYAVTGKIDRVDMINSVTYVVEYKWSYKKYNQSDYLFELSLYAKLLEKNAHLIVNHGAVMFLQDGDIHTYEITDDMKNEAISRILNVRGEIFRCLATDNFVKRVSPLCKYCEYKNICDAYRKHETQQNVLPIN